MPDIEQVNDSSRDSITLGLFQLRDVVRPEEQDEYAQLGSQLVAELNPCGILEETFVAAIVGATWRLRRGSELKEVKVEARVAVPDPPIAYQLALAGVGIAVLAESVMRTDVQRRRLTRILPEWEPEPAQLYALYSARLDSSPKVRALLQFLQERLDAEIPPHARRTA